MGEVDLKIVELECLLNSVHLMLVFVSEHEATRSIVKPLYHTHSKITYRDLVVVGDQ